MNAKADTSVWVIRAHTPAEITFEYVYTFKRKASQDENAEGRRTERREK